MNNNFNEKHFGILKSIDPEIADFYTDWLSIHDADEFETVANLSAHLARETLEALREEALKENKLPEHTERIWKDIVLRLDKFRHRHKVWDPPYKNEDFIEIWSEFRNLLLYIVESGLNFRNIAEHNPFNSLQDALIRLETKLDKAPRSEWKISSIEYSDEQHELNQNLKTFAPLLAAFYRDLLRIRQSTNFKCRSYLLGHLAREIDGGFRDILSIDKDKDLIEQAVEEEDLGKQYKSKKGHIASIMSALGVPDFNLRAEQWIKATKDLHILTHKNSGNKAKSLRYESEPLWSKFEELLTFLVGGYLDLLNRVDKILDTEEPNEDMVGTLPNILKLEVLYKHFFQNLKSPAWLKPLKKDGWFDPENNPIPQEDPEYVGYYNRPRWYALEYVEKIATQSQNSLCDETISILVNIVNAIIDYTDENGKRINNDYTNLLLIEIIGKLPIDEIKLQHITFMECALKSKSKFGLMDQEIAETILPKLLYASADELSLDLLRVMLEAKVVKVKYDSQITEAAKVSVLNLLATFSETNEVAPEIIADVDAYESKFFYREKTYMDEYYLSAALKENCESIAKLCGVKAAIIVLDQIRILINKGVNSFNHIQMVGTESSDDSKKDYPELLVDFASCLFRFSKPDEIAETVETLMHDSQTIIKRIALKAVKYHYSDFKQLFWGWDGNPLEETNLKPELYQLIKTNCTKFSVSEIEQMLDWIESAQYNPFFSRDDDTRTKAIAYKRREWLSALMETGNEKVLASYKKYEQINPATMDHPGFNRRTEIWAGSTSPITIEELSSFSNEQIANYLITFREPEYVIRKSDPTEEGLAETLQECVVTNPKRFTENLQPFLDIQNFYLHRMLFGFMEGWRNKQKFDWAALLEFINQVLLSERFWTEQHSTNCNYRQWTLIVIADLITSGTVDDEHAFDPQLLPLAEQILFVLVEKVEPSPTTLDRFLNVDPNSCRGKVFLAMINYALRFARLNILERGERWPKTIRDDFNKRLDRNFEPSFEFSFTLGMYLSNLLYLDEEWTINNLQKIFPKQDELHWQAAFSGYLLSSQPCKNLYSIFKKNGHYQKALTSDFANDKVIEALVDHVCIGWIQDWEALDDDKSLINQLIKSHNPNLLSALVHFFLEEDERLGQSDEPEKVMAYNKVKAKVLPAWRSLYQVLTQHSSEEAYQKVLSLLLGWLELVDEIDSEVLEWVEESIKHIGKFIGYGYTLTRVINALRKHAQNTPELVGEIYLNKLPERIIRDLQTDQDDIIETVRILYKNGCKNIANKICNRFGKSGVNFLRPIYEEYNISPN